jgi:hypothetical protein
LLKAADAPGFSLEPPAAPDSEILVPIAGRFFAEWGRFREALRRIADVPGRMCLAHHLQKKAA